MDNNLIGNDRLIMEIWKQYFYETVNIKDNVEVREAVIYQGFEEQIEPPTKDEVWEITRTLKNNQLPGEDYISAEIIKYGDKKLWKEIHTLIEVIWASEKMPENWQTATMHHIHKKGIKLQCSNHRGIIFCTGNRSLIQRKF
jgi:hypothetical protein